MTRVMSSQLCKQETLTSAVFAEWADRLRPAWDGEGSGKSHPLHRKLWEWIFIAQALSERGMLAPGRRGLGFGVGQEPLVALFASFGCDIVATDLDPDTAAAAGWDDGAQYAGSVASLNIHGLCPPAEFAERVSFRPVDMNAIPAQLTGFDFTWSSCAFEHLGSLDAGKRFIVEQMDCLAPGGIAVHTTEYNVSSNDATIASGPTVLFRRRDMQDLARSLRRRGHRIRVDYAEGDQPADRHIDAPPFSDTHLKIQLASFVTTSFGLVVRRGTGSVLDRVPALAGARP
jgi:SAM-dependent methyltransferase